MEIVAPLSKFKKNNFKIYIILCLAMIGWCVYDGYVSEDFIARHTDAEGNPDATLVFSLYGPYVFAGIAVLVGIYWWMVRERKVVADDEGVVVRGERIRYEDMQQVDKTHFDKKGYFVVTYNSGAGEKKKKISDRNYDNLGAVLDVIVAKMTGGQGGGEGGGAEGSAAQNQRS